MYFAHTGIAYHVGVLGDSKRRQEYNEAQRTTHTFRIRVTIENLAKATLLVEKAQRNPWFHPWHNCTHTISTLIYGYPDHYTWLGSFGWGTRKVLKDVQALQAAQLT